MKSQLATKVMMNCLGAETTPSNATMVSKVRLERYACNRSHIHRTSNECSTGMFLGRSPWKNYYWCITRRTIVNVGTSVCFLLRACRFASHLKFDTPKSSFHIQNERLARCPIHINIPQQELFNAPSTCAFFHHSTTISSSCRATERLLTGTNDTACKSCALARWRPCCSVVSIQQARGQNPSNLAALGRRIFILLLEKESRASPSLLSTFCMSSSRWQVSS